MSCMNSCPPPIDCQPMCPRIDIPITHLEYEKGVLRAYTHDIGDIVDHEPMFAPMVCREKSFEVVCSDGARAGDFIQVKDYRSAPYIVVNPETYASIITMLGSKNTDAALDVLLLWIQNRIDSSFAALKNRTK